MSGLAKCRTKIGLSQKELGEKVGIAQSAIANYETQRRTPSLRNARKIVRTLNEHGANCTLDEVFPNEY